MCGVMIQKGVLKIGILIISKFQYNKDTKSAKNQCLLKIKLFFAFLFILLEPSSSHEMNEQIPYCRSLLFILHT